MGIFNTGAALGGAVSPPIIAWLATRLRLALDVHRHRGCSASAGSRCGSCSSRCPRSTRGSPRRSARTSCRTAAAPGAGDVDWQPGWGELLTYRQTWAVVVGRFITDPIWWLYIFWLPSYFQEARGFSLQQIGWSAWLPFLCAGIGALGGGWASGHLIQRGWTVDRARKTVMAFGALLTPAGILAMRAENPYTALLLMGVVLFGFQVWINNLQTLPSDFFPKSRGGLGVRPRRHVGGDRERDVQLGHRPRRRRDGLHADVRRGRRARAARARGHAPARGPDRAARAVGAETIDGPRFAIAGLWPRVLSEAFPFVLG